MNPIPSTFRLAVRNLALAALVGATLGLAVLPSTARALNLTTELNHPAVQTLLFESGDTPQITVNGRSFNADPQGAFVPGGLQAFYRLGDGGAARPVGDVPSGGELNIGRNSEFTSSPTNSGWWITDNAAFRGANGVPGTPSNVTLPPYLMRKFLSPSGTTNSAVENNFTVRMEGQINVPVSGNYTLSGSGDDRVRLYVNGLPAYDSRVPARNPNPITLTAGTHSFTADFVEYGGGQNYSFGLSGPGTVTYNANAQDEHTYAGATLEIGRTFTEQRQGYLTGVVKANTDGSGSVIRPAFHYKGSVNDNYADQGGPSPVADNFRLILTGYWNVPTDGLYDFTGGADDRYWFAISNNPLDNPNSIANVTDNTGLTAPASVSGVNLTVGLKPVRFEFGEGGGTASFDFSWRNTGAPSYSVFDPNSLFTTEEAVFDYELIAQIQGQITSLSDLYNYEIPEELLGELLTMRLRAYASDLTFTESSFQFIASVLPVPEPSSLSLLGLGFVALIRRRRMRK